ncbi:MAG: N-acetylglucosamine-6-phosphate deacetylase [Erysipelotrichales bacterium]|nr:MAG: N-acetylglucosamine-6-phosphate deacetylase [Erysipelotrichales bacterium]
MYLQSERIWIDEDFKPAILRIDDGKIRNILPYGSVSNVTDYGNRRVFPGFIDIHSHGYQGSNANDISPEGLLRWVEVLPSEGVTSFLFSTSTAPVQRLYQSMRVYLDTKATRPKGANMLGIHMEGPFLSVEFRGAHHPEWLLEPDVETFKPFLDLCKNELKMIAIAVERDTDLALSKFCIAQGIRVAIGHSAANLEDVRKARAVGVNDFTHTYNAMKGLHHREPGTVGAAMRFDDMYAEVIADGVHVHFDAVNILGIRKGKDKLITVTDAVSIKGLTPGVHVFSDRTVMIDEKGCGHLEDGRLAGSSNRMSDLLNNLVGPCELPWNTSVNSMTKNPATFLGIADHKGSIAIGLDADITILDDDFNIVETYVDGKSVFKEAK